MTDNEIIKALECCAERISCDQHCPYWHTTKGCDYVQIKVILDLINRQKAEIEREKGYFEKLKTANMSLSKKLYEIRAEAVKEFEERAIKNICEKVYAPTPVQSCIVEKCNQVIIKTAKEMVGEG